MRQTKRLKNRYLLVIPMFLFGFLLSAFPVNPTKVSAAACTLPTTDYGIVTSNTSSKITIPGSGTTATSFRVWSRIQTPDPAKSSYLLEIDGNTCFNVGGNTTATNWTWVDYQNGTTTNKINVSLAPGDHTYRLIGNADGVLLDRIIFADATNTVCNPPQGTGDNCVNPVNVAPTVSLTASPASGTAPLNTTLTAAPADSDGTISKVEFFGGTTSLGSKTTAPWTLSLTGIAAGTYTYTAKATDNSGAVSVSSNTVTVTSTGTVVRKPGDANLDTFVDTKDAVILSLNWGKTGMSFNQGNFNESGAVDTQDAVILSLNWGK